MKASSPLFFLSLLLLGVWPGVITAQAQPVGTVVAWGLSDYGQTNVPAGLSGVTAIAAGIYHAAALRNDGTVMAWGQVWNGSSFEPAAVPANLNEVIAIAAGRSHTVALRSDGSMVAWGYNAIQTTVPAGAQSGVTAIAAGYDHTVALKNDGSVIAWGMNNAGQTTVPVAAQSGVKAIAAGESHTVALKNDGSVVAWGYNAYGQTTVPVEAQSGVTRIAAGTFHSVALKADGSVFAWGYGAYGQTTVPVAAQSEVKDIAAGFGHTVALKNDGSVFAWGWNAYDQTNVPVVAQSGVTAIAAGAFYTVALIGTPAQPRLPLPPQKIFLAFNQPSSFSLIVPSAFGRAWPVVNPFGSMPAATVSDSYRNSVTSQIKDIYSRSGIHNIEWTTADSDDAIAVYFCPAVNPDLLGYSKGPPDRFNSKRRGEVIVFVNETVPNLDAESAAHEIGHALGLRHVDPPVAADPSNEEVMDLDFSPSPEFINAVSDVTDITSFSTHNARYHLLRYVDGWSPTRLQNTGINPGSWDNGSFISMRFSFQNENLRLYNITVFASGGNTESSFALEQISSATLAELSGRSFAVPEGLGIVLLASSTTNGLPDVISSTGDAFSAANQVISPSGTNAFSLFRQDSPTNAVVVSTATAEFDAQTPHCNIFVSAPGVLRLDFRGTLQTSTTLTNWTDVGAVSPHFIVVGLTNKAGFFRSRQ